MTGSDELAEAFFDLSPARKAIVIARVIHAETIRARVAYYEKPPATDVMFRASERMHRLAGYTMGALSHDDAQRDVFAWELLTASASASDNLVDMPDWIEQARRGPLAEGVY